ncbi:hypothetical protein FS837_009560 [Tulasnella sp. UAMH 9824]|nr:hypothetical protein FS837_009560 [Tulasnella sp. UAMH 9824]
MEDGIPSLSTGAVGSRFVSQTEIDAANATRDEQWKAAYARIGQEPPPRPVEDYDGRSLFERLQEQKTLKQEQWDEKMKLSNQFRGIDEEDSAFLAQVQDDRIEQEKLKKKQDAEELAAFRAGQAKLAEKTSPAASSSSAPPAAAAAPAKPSKPAPAPAPSKSSLGKKDQKSILKGVVIKKKDKDKPKAKKQESSDSAKAAESEKANPSAGGEGSAHKRKADEPAAASGPDDGNKKARITTSND